MTSTPQPLDITPADAHARTSAGVRLIDIREDDERAMGMAQQAQGIAMGQLLAEHAALLPDEHAEVLLICASGRRSLSAAQTLAERGYSRARSVAGGMQRWQAEHLPMNAGNESPAFLDRYSRHLLLPEVGLRGQQRLRDARVALVGAGGLGSPVALYLAAAGIGQITLIDDDRVERSNLQRQVLHREADIGRPKVDSGRTTLLALNPDIEVVSVQRRLQVNNVESLLAGHDVIVDGSDNFATRYLVNDACIALQLPLVYGAVQRFEGQVAVFWPAAPAVRGACYRCLFPQPPAAHFAPNCAEAGVLGVLPGLIGTLQATETVKLLLGIGEPLVNRLLRVDALSMRFDRIGLSHDPACGSCGEPRSPVEIEGIPACTARATPA